MELIVINSAGPMASTILGSIIEHCGYLNLPVRKRDLHGYLLGNRKLEDPFFKERTLKILEDMAEVRTGGGTGVKDRNATPPIKRTNLELIAEDIKEYKAKKFRSINQMYIESNELIRKAVIYNETGAIIVV